MLLIGHRGLPDRAPQNTIDGFLAAFDAGLDGIELDVRLTRDRRAVVAHDPAPVEQLTWAQIRKRMPWVPLLTDALDAVRGRGLINMELKTARVAHEAVRAARETLGDGIRDTLTITSFEDAALREAASAAPRVQRGLLIGGDPREMLRRGDQRFVARARAVQAGVTVTEVTFLPWVASRAQRAGLKVWSWNGRGELLGSSTKVFSEQQISRSLGHGCDAAIIDSLPG